jgi:tRNA pseudouridine65 synthase
LTDKAEGRKSPQGLVKNRIPSDTQFSVIKESNYLSLCEFRLGTGRQHQIRKHAALAKHAIIGDSRYGSPNLNKKIMEIYKLKNSNRMYLHCVQITIKDKKLISNSLPDFDIFFDKKN